MKTALITGTSKGIGRAAALALLSEGFRVVGISRTSADINNRFYSEILMDLTDTKLLCDTVSKLTSEYCFDILINNAGIGFYGLHETLTPAQIHQLTTVNLEVPMLLCSLLMKQLKKTGGVIINISSVTAKKSSNTHGAAYGAVKSGLSSFSSSLFDEVRKHGVRVVTIHPDMTDTSLYRNADFTADTSKGCSLSSDVIADAVIYAISRPEGINIGDITITPQFHRIMRKNRGRSND